MMYISYCQKKARGNASELILVRVPDRQKRYGKISYFDIYNWRNFKSCIIGQMITTIPNKNVLFLHEPTLCNPPTTVHMPALCHIESWWITQWSVFQRSRLSEDTEDNSSWGRKWLVRNTSNLFTVPGLSLQHTKLTQASVTWLVTQKGLCLFTQAPWAGLNCFEYVNASQSSQSPMEALGQRSAKITAVVLPAEGGPCISAQN